MSTRLRSLVKHGRLCLYLSMNTLYSLSCRTFSFVIFAGLDLASGPGPGMVPEKWIEINNNNIIITIIIIICIL